MMGNFRQLIVILCLFCTVFSAQAATVHNKAYRNFWHPMFLGERLDYCSIDGKECGKPVADRYCRMQGYDYSSQQVIAYNIGLTHYLTARAQCKGWSCNGFMTIGCAMGLSHTPAKPYHYRERRFAVPRYNDYRIDWCYNKGKACGRRAADSFCSHMGFMRAKQFVKASDVSATKTIGSEELCFGSQCNAFKTIVCSR